MSLASPLDKLNTEELEVLELIALGYTDEKIADVVGVSTASVRSRVRLICAKLGENNRTAAVTTAFCLGVLTPEVIEKRRQNL